MRRSLLALFILIGFYFSSCNKYKRFYNEIPPLPPANVDFTQKHIEIVNTLIKDDDENDELYWQRAILLLKVGKSQESLTDIKRAIELNDKKLYYFKTLAQAYLLNNKYDSAIIAANYAREAGNDDYQLNLILAEAYINKGNPNKSLSEIAKAMKIDPNYSHSYYLRGMAYKALKDTAKFYQDFNTSLKLDQSDKKVYKELLNFYLATSNYLKAKSIINEMFAKFEPDLDMYFEKGHYFEVQNKYDSAYQSYGAALRQDSSLYQISLKMGNIKLKNKEYFKAIQHYKDVIKYKNDNFEAQYKLAMSYDALRNYTTALTELEKALSFDTTNQIVKADIAKINGKIERQKQYQLQRQAEEQRRVILLPEIPKIENQ